MTNMKKQLEEKIKQEMLVTICKWLHSDGHFELAVELFENFKIENSVYFKEKITDG